MSNAQLQDVYICPTFTTYSSDRLSVETSDGDDDFEFAFFREGDVVEVMADDLFHDGRIRQVFPVFNLDPPNDGGVCGGRDPPESRVAISPSKLFVEEDIDRDYWTEVSSLDNVPAGTYCVWRPKTAADTPLPGQCEKRKSTGSASKRWNLRDLMRPSRSDGKENFVILTPTEKSGKWTGAPNGAGRRGFRSAHEVFYARNKAIIEGDKKKSYLPYRQELVGILANVDCLSGSSLQDLIVPRANRVVR